MTNNALIVLAVEVRDGLSFLDLTVNQISIKNKAFKTRIPLILMNSFNTDQETKKIINVLIAYLRKSSLPKRNPDQTATIRRPG